MATINDIAKIAGVSVTTVSRVVNKPSLVNTYTKKRVLNVIQELNYTPNLFARGMRGQRTKSFGVIIPDFMNLYYSEFISHLEIEARSHSYHTIICSTKNGLESDKEYIDELLYRQVDGLILCWYKSASENREFLEGLAQKVPVVLMDQPSSGLPISAVYADAYSGIKELTNYLISRGHSKIAIIKAMKKYPVAKNRFLAYIDALRENNIKIDEKLVEESDFTAASAYDAAGRLFSHIRPSALIGASDVIAIGAMKLIIEKGWNIPGDIALAGYDNIALSSLISPQLTTVAEPIKRMACEAVRVLLKKIHGERIRKKDVVLKTRLIIRGTTEVDKKVKILM